MESRKIIFNADSLEKAKLILGKNKGKWFLKESKSAPGLLTAVFIAYQDTLKEELRAVRFGYGKDGWEEIKTTDLEEIAKIISTHNIKKISAENGSLLIGDNLKQLLDVIATAKEVTYYKAELKSDNLLQPTPEQASNSKIYETSIYYGKSVLFPSQIELTEEKKQEKSLTFSNK